MAHVTKADITNANWNSAAPLGEFRPYVPESADVPEFTARISDLRRVRDAVLLQGRRSDAGIPEGRQRHGDGGPAAPGADQFGRAEKV